MEFVAPEPDDAERVVEELWLPLAREMADIDPYNELAEDVRSDAVTYRRRKLSDPDVFVRVAADAGEWVGYVQATFAPSPPVFDRGDAVDVNELWVAPERRGEGLARELMARAESWGRERGAERARLSVNADNEAGRSLYESLGYEVRRLRMDRGL